LQWYWRYEYSDFIKSLGGTIEFDRYAIADDLLEQGQIRLIVNDTAVAVPVNTHVRFVVTSGDVLHDFPIPSLGIKVDDCPGRLNILSALIQREGVFYCMCSELCGTALSQMPIKLEDV